MFSDVEREKWKSLFFPFPSRGANMYSCNMIIELLGLSGVKIQSNNTVILLSPPSEKSEIRASRFKADCIVLGNPNDKINVDPREEKLFIVDSTGEYETSGIFIYCISNPEKGNPTSLMSLIKIEGISIAHLACLGNDLTDNQLELFEGADILIIPIGGKDVLDAKRAKEIIEKIEPRIVIPMHFAQKNLKTAYDSQEKFFKEIGSNPEAQDKAKITKKELPQETMEVINLKI